MTYPCKGCGFRARYELLPVSVHSHRMPTYWCAACWEGSFQSSRQMREGMRLLRAAGGIRDLEPGGDAGEPEEGGRGQ